MPDEQPGIFLDAENGDIVIRAGNGRMRLEAIDIDIRVMVLMVREVTSSLMLMMLTIMKGQVVDVNAKAWLSSSLRNLLRLLVQQSLIYTVGLLTWQMVHVDQGI